MVWIYGGGFEGGTGGDKVASSLVFTWMLHFNLSPSGTALHP
jgi:hypothetical protein